MRVDILVLKKI